MLTALYAGFILLGSLYFLLAPRKGVPTLVLTHALLQYLWTLGIWGLRLSESLTGLIWLVMAISSLLLWWSSRLPYGRSQKNVELFFTMAAWAVLIMMVALISLRSPFVYLESHEALPAVGLHPAIRYSGNLMLFLVFLPLVLNHGQYWTLRHSLATLGPGLIYFCMILFLRYLQVELHEAQISQLFYLDCWGMSLGKLSSFYI